MFINYLTGSDSRKYLWQEAAYNIAVIDWNPHSSKSSSWKTCIRGFDRYTPISALQDYQMQLMLLEAHNKKRLIMAYYERDHFYSDLCQSFRSHVK